ncbi:dihydrofolate reductase [Virgibacillus halotolerans]|uniref:dihydrofolate reductase n=1 Tax=Virgibacillus halotolerans TaxID=1071053 RepID=UPI001960C415|nr:dihydrofolate reductase [Virgibacillus halotolerans]MBM7598295.1 dihydrofolate reductase [Virgibacillus halotolerans]
MEISIIAAIGKNNEIGLNNKLLWHIPEDMSWFKLQTMGKTVILGKNTHLSIKKPLNGRVNVILTRDETYRPQKGVIVCNGIKNALYEFRHEKEVMVLGGSDIYRQMLPFATKLYLTKVNHEFEADSFFPEIDYDEWDEYYYKKGKEDSKYNYSFHVYSRKSFDSLIR